MMLLVGLAWLSRAGEAVAGTAVAPDQPFISRSEVRQQGPVTVRAATLTDDESEHFFRASLADHGIQAVWVSVENAGDSLLRFLPIVTDATYFSAAEVEELLGGWWQRQRRNFGDGSAHPNAGDRPTGGNGHRFRLYAP